MSINFDSVKLAVRWLYDNGKKLSPEVEEACRVVTEVQYGKYLIKVARYFKQIEHINERMEREEDKTPDPPFARKLRGEALLNLMSQDTRDHFIVPPRLKSY